MTSAIETESYRASFLWHMRFFGKSTTEFSQLAVSPMRPAGEKTNWQFISQLACFPFCVSNVQSLVKSYTELSLDSWNIQFLCCMIFSRRQKGSIIKNVSIKDCNKISHYGYMSTHTSTSDNRNHYTLCGKVHNHSWN